MPARAGATDHGRSRARNLCRRRWMAEAPLLQMGSKARLPEAALGDGDAYAVLCAAAGGQAHSPTTLARGAWVYVRWRAPGPPTSVPGASPSMPLIPPAPVVRSAPIASPPTATRAGAARHDLRTDADDRQHRSARSALAAGTARPGDALGTHAGDASGSGVAGAYGGR